MAAAPTLNLRKSFAISGKIYATYHITAANSTKSVNNGVMSALRKDFLNSYFLSKNFAVAR